MSRAQPSPTVPSAPHLVLVPASTLVDVEPSGHTDDVDRAAHLDAVAAPAAQVFCERLKALRERRGVSLASIERTSKVSVSYFRALERGDLSRWPKGVFRRSYFRDYAAAVGVDVGAALAEFLELFPEAGAPRARRLEAAAPLRLTLAEPEGPPFSLPRMRRWLAGLLIGWAAALRG